MADTFRLGCGMSLEVNNPNRHHLLLSMIFVVACCDHSIITLVQRLEVGIFNVVSMISFASILPPLMRPSDPFRHQVGRMRSNKTTTRIRQPNSLIEYPLVRQCNHQRTRHLCRSTKHNQSQGRETFTTTRSPHQSILHFHSTHIFTSVALHHCKSAEWCNGLDTLTPRLHLVIKPPFESRRVRLKS